MIYLPVKKSVRKLKCGRKLCITSSIEGGLRSFNKIISTHLKVVLHLSASVDSSGPVLNTDTATLTLLPLFTVPNHLKW